MDFPVGANTNTPALAHLAPADVFDTAFVMRGHLSILHVLGVGAFAKVDPGVVVTFPVAMVNLIFGPLTGNYRPCDSVAKHLPAVYLDRPIGDPMNFSRRPGRGSVFVPIQATGDYRVAKKLPQPSSRRKKTHFRQAPLLRNQECLDGQEPAQNGLLSGCANSGANSTTTEKAPR